MSHKLANTYLYILDYYKIKLLNASKICVILKLILIKTQINYIKTNFKILNTK